MSAVLLVKAATAGPDDVDALKLLAAEGLGVDDVIAVAAKTEGNGCVNDFSRTLGARAWHDVLPAAAVTVMSGGTEGVLSPHATLVVRAPWRTGLRGASASTPPIPKAVLGRRPQVDAVARTVGEAVADAGLRPQDVHLVLVKCPLLTSEDVAACRAAGTEPVTTDTYESMARSRSAAALGVALALGERTGEEVDAALAAGGWDAWSGVASCSSGAEIADCQVLVLGSDPAGGPLRMAHTVLHDAIDAGAVLSLLAELGAGPAGEGAEVVHAFAKAEAAPDGLVRGRRHTMLTDSDLHSTRHARAAVGGLLAGLVGDPCLYVSGGAENQGPPGGGPLALVVRASS
ncbi:cyanuric acid amidohydrolase [Motilibacter rhizosphaerae]|uniref:Cyanuric acid amidohydrolase n=1 Tax=Motilibacter rhizosphaerae TaxID=598652 RepID=A0A4Q7NWX0_9ACTN|nr:ring-opening amidohydrolase [Motilibacter rhizosphaerae]RZS91697.1 cyanuric acid amidohydrolase [Motilibacter rhizosphaerae]